MLADQLDYVVGVDPHRDVHALAIVEVRTGGVVLETSVAASSGGYARARSGDRRLNRALHMILVTRRRAHPPTIAYNNRRVQDGKSGREASRCLKRYLARNLCRLLEHGAPLAT
jgi:transposase